MNNNRSKYSAAEKAKIALAAINGNMTMAEISSKYSVHATQINKWKKQLAQQLPEIFSNRDRKKPHDSSLPHHLAYGSVPRRFDTVKYSLLPLILEVLCAGSNCY